MPIILLPECTACITKHKYYRCGHLRQTTDRVCRACTTKGHYGPFSEPANQIKSSSRPCSHCVPLWKETPAKTNTTPCLTCGVTHNLFKCGHVKSIMTEGLYDGGCEMCHSRLTEPVQFVNLVGKDCKCCALTVCAKRAEEKEEMELVKGPCLLSTPIVVVRGDETPLRIEEMKSVIKEKEPEDEVCCGERGWCKYCHVASMEVWSPASA
jgi:hypothetical protein